MNSPELVRTSINPEDSPRGPTYIHQESPRFGDTNVSGGNSFQGNFVGLTINSTVRPDYRGQFSHSSLEPVKAFVPRPLLRDQIRTQLGNVKDVANGSTKTLVVWGLGGAGKSQLVLDYVQRYHTDYQATFWIEAGRKESLERDLVNLYQTLFGVQMTAGKETVSVDSAVIGVKSWFAGRQGPWLMVFDGADTIENKEASEYIDIRHFIPDVASLHVIVTSRSRTAKDMTRLDGVHVGAMEEAQAAELFYRYAPRLRHNQDVEKEEVKMIVKELGYLALAVTLAGTYVGQTPRLQSDINAYLPEYQTRRRELLKRNPETLVHQYSASVLTTWETSYQAIVDISPEAAILMTMLSFLSFDDIFLQLFSTRRIVSTGSIDDASTANWRSFLFPDQVIDVYKVEECFNILQRFSFVQWKEDQRSYAMHKLVHAWGYDRLSGDKQSILGLTTFLLILEVMDGCGDAPEDKLRLVPHIMANFAIMASGKGLTDGASEIILDELERIGIFVRNIGRLPDGRIIQEFIWTERRGILGEEHLDTISAMNNLANTLGVQGQLDKAAAIQKEVLQKRRRILGEEHLDTISAINNLANTLGVQGQLDKAAAMKKEVLQKMRRILGEEHPSTISAMNNLVSTLGVQGQLDEAAAIQKEVLQKRRRILGEEHPSTISAMNNLASTLADQGQLDEAVAIKKEVLQKRRRILGEEHLDTISAMNNLASTLGDQGQLDEAAAMKKEVLQKGRRILGEEHPSTISAMNNLASTLGDQGQLDEAAAMKKEVLQKRRRILGEEHLDTISAMNNLANTLGDQGQLKEAAAMKKEVLQKRRRILGEEHLDTISAMNNLANTLGDQGQLNEAAAMKKEVLQKRRRILGEEHPDTISAMNNLANTLGDQGQLDEAAAMKKEVLQKMRRILGEEHPSTISAMNNLANTLGDQGQLDEAVAMKKEVLQKMRRILGEEHPDTISAMNNLANTLGDQGQLDEAAAMKKEVLQKMRRILGEEHPSTISAMNNLAITLGDQGQLDEAIALLEAAKEKVTWICGDQHPTTKLIINNLTRLSARVAAQNATVVNGNDRKEGQSIFTRVKRKLRKRDSAE